MSWLRLARAPAVFSAVSNVFAAQLIASGGLPDFLLTFQLVVASSFLYLAGMILNDCFDLEEDSRERPGRPLPTGEIATETAWRVGWSLIIAANLVALWVGWTQFLISAALSAAIILYNAVAKRSAIGPLAMGLCRYLNWLLGLSTALATAPFWLLPAPILLYTAAVTALSRAETGENVPHAVTMALAALAAAVALWTVVWVGGMVAHPLAAFCLVVAAGWLALRLRALRSQRDSVVIQQAVSLMILGFVPLDALVASAIGPWWSGLLVLILMVPARALARIAYVT